MASTEKPAIFQTQPGDLEVSAMILSGIAMQQLSCSTTTIAMWHVIAACTFEVTYSNAHLM